MAVKEVAHGNQKYPWDDWTDGEWHRLISGTKRYPRSAETIRRQICDYARLNSLKAKTRVKGRVVSFCLGK